MATFTTLTGKKGYADGAGADTHIIGADALKVSISGNMNGDQINIEGLAADYRIKAKGRTVTLTDGVQTIVFKLANDGTVNLRFLDGDLDVTFNGKKASVEGQQLGSKLKYFSATNLENLGSNSSAGVFDEVEAPTPFTLTAGVDTFVGTSGADVFNAPVQFGGITPTVTINPLDSVDGGNGIDRMNIEGLYTITADISNIENIFFKGVDLSFSGSANSIDAENFDGAQQIWLNGGNIDANTSASDTASNKLTVNNLTDEITFGLKGNVSGDAADIIDLVYKTGSTVSNIALDDLASERLVRVGSDVTTINVSGSVDTTAAGTPDGGIGIDQGTDKATTLNISTSSTIALDASQIGTLTKIDASASTGAVFAKIDLSDSTNLGVNYLGGSGNDTIYASLTDLDTKDLLKGNGGIDNLVLDVNTSDTGSTNFTFTASVASISDSGYALINKADFERVTFNGINIGGSDSISIDASKLSARQIGTEETTTISKLENADSVIFANSASGRTLTLQAKVDATNLTKFDSASGTVNLVAETKGQTVTVAQNDGVGSATSAFSKLVLTGAGNVTFDNADTSNNNTAKAAEIDASGLTGNLRIASTVGAVDKITLGSGADIVRLIDTAATSTYNATDIITGFTAGKDKLLVNDIVGSTDGVKVIEYKDGGADFSQAVSNALQAAVAGTKDVAFFAWNGDTYVVQDVATGGTAGVFDQTVDIVVRLVGSKTLADTDFVTTLPA